LKESALSEERNFDWVLLVTLGGDRLATAVIGTRTKRLARIREDLQAKQLMPREAAWCAMNALL